MKLGRLRRNVRGLPSPARGVRVRPAALSILTAACVSASLTLFACQEQRGGKGAPESRDPKASPAERGAQAAPAQASPKDAAPDAARLPGQPEGAPLGPGQSRPAGSATGAEIVIEEPGRDPVELVYHFAQGQKKKFTMKMSVDPKVTVNGRPLPGAAKTSFEVQGRSEVLEVAPDGTARRLSSFERFTPLTGGLPPQAVAQLKAQLGLLAGLKIEERVTNKGALLGAEIVEIPAQDPGIQAMIKNLQDGLSNAVLTLPQGKIGEGGRFRTHNVIEAMGMKLTQITRFTVESIRDDALKVDVQFEQSTPPAVMAPENLPEGAKVELLGLKGQGHGKVQVNLRTLDMTSEVDLSMKIDTRTQAPGAPEPISSTTENKLQVSVKVRD